MSLSKTGNRISFHNPNWQCYRQCFLNTIRLLIWWKELHHIIEEHPVSHNWRTLSFSLIILLPYQNLLLSMHHEATHPAPIPWHSKVSICPQHIENLVLQLCLKEHCPTSQFFHCIVIIWWNVNMELKATYKHIENFDLNLLKTLI